MGFQDLPMPAMALPRALVARHGTASGFRGRS